MPNINYSGKDRMFSGVMTNYHNYLSFHYRSDRLERTGGITKIHSGNDILIFSFDPKVWDSKMTVGCQGGAKNQQVASPKTLKLYL